MSNRTAPIADAETETRAGLPIRGFASAALFKQWMVGQHPDSKGIWLKLSKQGSGVASVSKAEAVEVALCHGWIDGQLNPYDERFWLIRFTPRSARSLWSEINRATVTRLMAEGRVSPDGLAQIEAARRDGRWDAAYARQSKAQAPADLLAALEANAAAKAFFATLKGANRYAVLYRIQDAKTPATCQARIEKFVAMLARGEVVHPPKRKVAKSS